MSKKRSQFWIFIFSLIPGAGEMYMGYMKRGVSLMLLFFGYILTSVWLGMGEMNILLPIIWFYSFFDVHNLKKLDEEEMTREKDQFIWGGEILSATTMNRTVMKILGVGLILVGGKKVMDSAFYSVACAYGSERMWEFYYFVRGELTQVIVGVVIVILGLVIIRGKKVSKEGAE